MEDFMKNNLLLCLILGHMFYAESACDDTATMEAEKFGLESIEWLNSTVVDFYNDDVKLIRELIENNKYELDGAEQLCENFAKFKIFSGECYAIQKALIDMKSGISPELSETIDNVFFQLCDVYYELEANVRKEILDYYTTLNLDIKRGEINDGAVDPKMEELYKTIDAQMTVINQKHKNLLDGLKLLSKCYSQKNA